MIGYLEGKLLRMEDERILLLANQVGYEVLLPANVMARIEDRRPGDALALFIFYHQTERQPRPVLIGFIDEQEREFFQRFISVEDIGPLKAAKALTLPIGEIARAIEARDVACLRQLKGIGQRTAQKIIAALEGKVDGFAPPADDPARAAAPAGGADPEVIQQVHEVLVTQLGYRGAQAHQLLQAAIQRVPAATTPERLLDEVLRGAHE